MANTPTKIRLTDAQKTWLRSICSKISAGQPVDKRSLLIELVNNLPKDFNPSDIDSRLLRGGDKITVIGIGLLDPQNILVKMTDEVMRMIRDLLSRKPRTEQINVKEISGSTDLAEEQVALIFEKLSECGMFSDSGTSYGRVGWASINISDRAFDNFVKYESLEQIVKSIVEDHETLMSQDNSKTVGKVSIPIAEMGSRRALDHTHREEVAIMEPKKKIHISGYDYEFNRETTAVEKLVKELGMEVPNLSGRGGLATEMRALYEDLVRNSDIFVGIYGSSIGVMVPDSHTGIATSMPYLEWEYRMAEEEGTPVLAFVQDVEFRDERLTQLLHRIITRKGAYRFLGQKDLIQAIKEKLPEIVQASENNSNKIYTPSEGGKKQEMPIQEATVEDASKPNPKVLMSYSWEEDNDHKRWVSDLGTRLRNEGVDIILDQWSTTLGDQLPHFMEQSVRDSDFVIFVCTPEYKRKSDNCLGGVGYEGHIITSEVYETNNQRKFIPVLRKGDWKETDKGNLDDAIPTWAKGKRGVDLRNDPYSEEHYETLLQYLHGITPGPPPLGPIPTQDRFKAKAAPSATKSRGK
jgi:TIR domain